jgi:hypothetical protein
MTTTPIDIVIGAPHGDRSLRFQDNSVSIIRMIEGLKAKGKMIAIRDSYGASISKNRNKCVETALEHDAKYLLFIDDDMVFEPSAIDKLLAHNEYIVSGLCTARSFPATPALYMKRKDDTGLYDNIANPKGLMSVDGVGMAFTLIDTTVFKRMKAPYFAMPPRGDDVLGEDLYFCEKAKELGIEVKVDCDVVIGHIGNYIHSIVDWEVPVDGQEGNNKSS